MARTTKKEEGLYVYRVSVEGVVVGSYDAKDAALRRLESYPYAVVELHRLTPFEVFTDVMTAEMINQLSEAIPFRLIARTLGISYQTLYTRRAAGEFKLSPAQMVKLADMVRLYIDDIHDDDIDAPE